MCRASHLRQNVPPHKCEVNWWLCQKVDVRVFPTPLAAKGAHWTRKESSAIHTARHQSIVPVQIVCLLASVGCSTMRGKVHGSPALPRPLVRYQKHTFPFPFSLKVVPTQMEEAIEGTSKNQNRIIGIHCKVKCRYFKKRVPVLVEVRRATVHGQSPFPLKN